GVAAWSAIGGAALIPVADGHGGPRIVAPTGLGGLELYARDGTRLGATPAGEVVAIDVGRVPLGGGKATVVAALDASSHSLRLFRFAGDRLEEVGARQIALGFAAEGLCLYRHPLDGALHVFVVGDGGEIDQQVLYATADGRLDARQVRRIGVPSPLVQCAVDAAAGQVYASEEEVGIWRFNADPEAEIAAALVDSPRGHIEEEVGGLAIHDGGPGSRWLIASNASAGTLNVYDLERDAAFVASVAVAARDGSGVDEPGLLHATSAPVGRRHPHGVLLVADEDGPDVKSIAIEALAAAIGASPGRAPAARAGAPAVPAVTALAETAPVASYGDAADDPAIWAHPTQPGRSLIVATDKKAGLYVYDM